jgi:hypothetical protein
MFGTGDNRNFNLLLDYSTYKENIEKLVSYAIYLGTMR